MGWDVTVVTGWVDSGIKRLNVNGKAKVQMSNRELEKPKALQKKNKDLS